MVTLKDIAVKVGVDVSTVSKVLQGGAIRVSEAKRAEIRRVAEELHYRPNMVARGLRLKRSGAIAMVVPSTTNYLYPEIIGGAEEAAEEHDTVLFLVKHSSVDPFGQLCNVVGQGRVDGLLFADDLPAPGLLERLYSQGIPFVSLNRYGIEDRNYVALDDEGGFEVQADYLAGLGHRTVAFVAVAPQSFVSKLCQKSFIGSLARRGVRMPPTHVVHCDFDGNTCEAAVETILEIRPRPTAIATASAVVAVRIVESLRTRGVRVPEDVSVVGYHELPNSMVASPSLTTVRMPSHAQGRRGVERLLQVIDGQSFAGEILSDAPKVLDRGTCAPFASPR
jgi:LacI family transcriptional regulator